MTVSEQYKLEQKIIRLKEKAEKWDRINNKSVFCPHCEEIKQLKEDNKLQHEHWIELSASYMNLKQKLEKIEGLEERTWESEFDFRKELKEILDFTEELNCPCKEGELCEFHKPKFFGKKESKE